MPSYSLSFSSYLKSDSRFEKFRQFWSREHSLNPAFTIRRPVKGMLKIYTEMPKRGHFLLPLHTAPELLSIVVQNMTKYGLGWTLWMCRKVLDHLSQKIFSGLISETFHPKPLCSGVTIALFIIVQRKA